MIDAQRIEARFCDMTREDLIELFDNRHTKQGCMFNDDPTSLIDSYETNELMEITVEMKRGHKITTFYGEEKVYIDLCSDSHVGLGDTVIYSDISEIQAIEVKWR